MLSSIGALDRQTVSDLSGTLSFVVWLFAQSPQIYENYRRGSVDGLSPVFLTQWMLGDATNLIGCILTQQLSFQIAVATYFCCIDVCIMGQFIFYWNKTRKERARRSKSKTRQRSNSLTSPYPANPYSVLSETSELLGGRTSRHNTYLRSTSRRRNLSHSQQLIHPHRHAHPHHDPHTSLIPTATTDKPSDASQADQTQHRHHDSSRSRSRHTPPLSRTGSSDTVSAVGGGSVANYRALSDAALSVAQLAQEAARRQEAMLHHVHLADEDYFSHRRPRSHRSKPRASSSPNHSQPPSMSRSRVNSNDLGRPETLRADLAASTHSLLATAEEREVSTTRRTRLPRSLSSRRRGVAGNVDFVPSALSPTRENRDLDDADAAAKTTARDEDEETEPESVSEGSASHDDAAAGLMADSVASLATVSTDCSTDSFSIEPRGRDMVRTASRIDPTPTSGAVTPIIAEMRRDGTTSPFSAHSSSDGTARHASPHPTSTNNTDRMSMSHHHLGQHEPIESSDDGEDRNVDKAPGHEVRKARKRRTHDSTRESSPSASMYRSVGTLKDGSRTRTLTRSTSSRSHTNRLAVMPMTASTSTATGSKKRAGTKSPSSMRRSIGKVLLGIMMITSLPPTSSAAIPTDHPLLIALLDDETAASWRRLVGRISAWLCALLYITSRIPQIWENHIRRSVAGLSILLFIAAFSGNLFYTISVLANPAASGEDARVYLQESLPFLLGSGGTLVFDLIIVGQWLAWRKNGVSI
ncbi:uncharacterized protein UTRI_01700_B [Ustilago trichophora]|uniref:Vacuolar membrane protein n=1 Tax=Ustilago trichophora TaxID=86804 RepID=A0A5C3E5P5_9BASI|nr:uncharacterized protein UTRI_01700_B [Ustilago trichophora]